jgi:hypothetical protein
MNQLLEDEEIQDPHKSKNPEQGKSQEMHTSSQNIEANPKYKGGVNGDI